MVVGDDTYFALCDSSWRWRGLSLHICYCMTVVDAFCVYT